MLQMRVFTSTIWQCIRAAVACFITLTALASAADAQTYTVIHSFVGVDGDQSRAALFMDRGGNFYGTSMWGGVFNCGAVFKVDSSGNETVLYSFRAGNVDGGAPSSPLVEDAAGTLYGTTYYDGLALGGTVFKLDTSGNETVLHNFTGGEDGAYPDGGLTLDGEGNLYGTASAGGSNSGAGTVFKIDGFGNITTLYTFQNSPDGAVPKGELVIDRAHNLYGTTFYGGDSSAGSVYKLDPDGNETILYSFKGYPDGMNPAAGLTMDGEGNLYGTTTGGGITHCGTLFKVDRKGLETTLLDFCEGKNGRYPASKLLLDAAGNLYGTTTYGGLYEHGTLFKLDKRRRLTVLFNFKNEGKGLYPVSGLIEDTSGNLYGTTPYGGLCIKPGCGIVFKITP